jgi:hypothetical protein
LTPSNIRNQAGTFHSTLDLLTTSEICQSTEIASWLAKQSDLFMRRTHVDGPVLDIDLFFAPAGRFEDLTTWSRSRDCPGRRNADCQVAEGYFVVTKPISSIAKATTVEVCNAFQSRQQACATTGCALSQIQMLQCTWKGQ